ncbi:hypothetical protein [Phaeobacter italicus]|uniref:hypothetical protein n=1 Tax=Phaeobacter italicus TaxID=481446 RepID=UPI0024312B22|nr:hypothetical protein [Phaeobacter italicus]MCI5100556.1 hypothetical protein [Phaeobacter italicus]
MSHPLRKTARRLATAAVVLCAAIGGTAPVWAAELLMVEQPGCSWCARWNEEIAPIYPKTAEGAFAPLRRADLRALPDDVALSRRVTFTPTFLIVDQGREMARLEGYPGEDFFWPLLTQLLQQHTSFDPETAQRPTPAPDTAADHNG